MWGLELWVSAPVRTEDKPSDELSVGDSPGSGDSALKAVETHVGKVEAMAKICPSCHRQGLQESLFNLS